MLFHSHVYFQKHFKIVEYEAKTPRLASYQQKPEALSVNFAQMKNIDFTKEINNLFGVSD